MTYELYLDVYFIMNLGMNFMILWVEKQLLRLPAKIRRLFLSSCMGAVWSCLEFFLPEYLFGWYGMCTIVVLGPAMVRIAFGHCSLRVFIKKTAGFYLITMLMAGVMEIIRRFLPTQGNKNQYNSIMGWILLLAGTVWLAHGLLGLFMEWKRKRTYLYQVVLHYRGQQTRVMALYDTGNRLREPYGKKPVHIITYEACKHICRTVPGVLYIPFTSVGADKGMVPAIQFDEMEVYQGEKQIEKIKHPIIAVIRRPLSPDGEYDMLLNEELGETKGGIGNDCQGLNTESFSV